MLSRLLTLAIVLGIAYFLLTKAGPMIQQQFGGRAARVETDSSSEEGLCVDQAFQANEMLTRVARQYGQPPVDVDSWSDAQWEIDSEIQSATVASNRACCAGSASSTAGSMTSLSCLAARSNCRVSIRACPSSTS